MTYVLKFHFRSLPEVAGGVGQICPLAWSKSQPLAPVNLGHPRGCPEASAGVCEDTAQSGSALPISTGSSRAKTAFDAASSRLLSCRGCFLQTILLAGDPADVVSMHWVRREGSHTPVTIPRRIGTVNWRRLASGWESVAYHLISAARAEFIATRRGRVPASGTWGSSTFDGRWNKLAIAYQSFSPVVLVLAQNLPAVSS